MQAQLILLAIAVIFLTATLLDWRKHPGGLTPKRRAWLLIAAIFGGISLLQLGGGL